MSGSNILLMSEQVEASGPTLHAVYSLDGLGANDPPVIPISFGAAATFVDFTYALPDDGNAHKRALCVMCFDPKETRVLSLSLGGTPVTFGINSIAGVNGGVIVYYGVCFLDALTGSSWRLTRANAVDGAVTGNVRIYTFGNADGIDTIFAPSNFIDLNTTPAPTVNSGTDANIGDCLFTIAMRDDWAVGRNYSVTSPLTFTYSPTGSAGVGLLTNGVNGSAALEFQFVGSTIVTPSTTWTFTNVQPGAHGAVTMFNFEGAVY